MGGGDPSARVAFKYLFSPYEPVNEGSFTAVKIVLPPGKLISASATAPLGYYQTPLSTVIDTIIAAVAPALPDRVAAGHFGALASLGSAGTTRKRGNSSVSSILPMAAGEHLNDMTAPALTRRSVMRTIRTFQQKRLKHFIRCSLNTTVDV